MSIDARVISVSNQISFVILINNLIENNYEYTRNGHRRQSRQGQRVAASRLQIDCRSPWQPRLTRDRIRGCQVCRHGC